MNTTTRNASLADLAEMLRDQHVRKHDLIVPASKLSSEGASLVVAGGEVTIDEDGVAPADGMYTPTAICDEQIASKLDIPLTYLRRLRTDRPDLYDANVNGWLRGTMPMGEGREHFDADGRSFMLRTFRDDDGGPGIARSLLSDRYEIVDNLDVLMASLEGVRDAGVAANVQSCDLTDRKMYVRVVAPEVTALAPTLLAGYRSPYDTGTPDGSPPVVFGGFEISNSETGGGAFTITPRLVVQICNNGLTMTRDAIRKVHVGGRLDEGVVRWSDDTQRRSLELVQAQTRDAVATFLDVGYMTSVLDRIEADAGRPVRKADELVRTIGKQLRFSDAAVDGMLDHFISGGQMTAGGILNAVTSYAQAVDDADVAHEIEASAMRAFDLALAAAN
jgi:hypothetical protein